MDLMQTIAMPTFDDSPSTSDPAEQCGRVYRADQLSTEGRTALGTAASKGDKEEVKRLISQGASPLEADAFQEVPLHLAALFGHLELVKILVKDYKVPIDPQNWESYTPLCCAVSRGHLQMVKYLLKNRANADWKSPHGWQIMHVAAWHNQELMVEWLSQNGAPTAFENDHGCRPFDITRPGATRRAVFNAMADERRGAQM